MVQMVSKVLNDKMYVCRYQDLDPKRHGTPVNFLVEVIFRKSIVILYVCALVGAHIALVATWDCSCSDVRLLSQVVQRRFPWVNFATSKDSFVTGPRDCELTAVLISVQWI